MQQKLPCTEELVIDADHIGLRVLLQHYDVTQHRQLLVLEFHQLRLRIIPACVQVNHLNPWLQQLPSSHAAWVWTMCQMLLL